MEVLGTVRRPAALVTLVALGVLVEVLGEVRLVGARNQSDEGLA
ncbi:MAG TPA: hypothetical protein VIO14_13305 [Dehalococcoidia bacterium]